MDSQSDTPSRIRHLVPVVMVRVVVVVTFTCAGTTTPAARRRWVVVRANAKHMRLLITGEVGAVK
jgi:lipopolysaccharide export LptBFGC system permease protein LptF